MDDALERAARAALVADTVNLPAELLPLVAAYYAGLMGRRELVKLPKQES